MPCCSTSSAGSWPRRSHSPLVTTWRWASPARSSAVLDGAQATPDDIALVSLSTTLATNALVEGRGGRVALVFIGFGEAEERARRLAEAMDGDPIIRISGGHDPLGSPLAELDVDALEREVRGGGSIGHRVRDLGPVRDPQPEPRARRARARCASRHLRRHVRPRAVGEARTVPGGR